jgi:hypothetical protein
MSGVFAPLASTATRNLPPARAGAGAGVYTMTRQVGSVLGSAAIAALMNARLAAELPGVDAEAARRADGGSAAGLPPSLAEGFTAAMSQSLWLAVAAFALCSVAVLFFARPLVTVAWRAEQPSAVPDADRAPARSLPAP